MMQPYVEVSGLTVLGGEDGAVPTRIIDDLSFTIDRGEVLALIGESGSGKTTAALALLGYVRHGCRIARGRIRLGETEVLALPRHALANLRGRRVSYVAQSAAAAFNPAHPIMSQVTEPALIHGVMTRRQAEAKACDLFQALALPDPQGIGDRFPHQVSGGQLQRLMAAMALIADPELVILDEPTTALDVTTQMEVLLAFKRAVRDFDTTALYVSHDLPVVAQVANRIVVLRGGVLQETASVATIIEAPSHPYTQSLIAAVKPIAATGGGTPRTTTSASAPPLLEASGLIAGYGGRDSHGLPQIPVLHGIDFVIESGSVLGVIGESGCGKSTLAQVVAGLLPAASGRIRLKGVELPASLEQRSRAQLQAIQIVFQMADVALNPARSVGAILARPLAFYHGQRGVPARQRVAELLDMVRLPATLAARYPDELSGGQKQRVNLARALAADPSVILCDEVTSALDTVVGAAILELLAELRRTLGVAIMFISHDLSTIQAISDHVVILYAGHGVEIGGRAALQQTPHHPYTDLLLSSVPELRPDWLEGISRAHIDEAGGGLSREDLTVPCPFFRRCAVRIPDTCDIAPPPARRFANGTGILCHRTEVELRRLQSADGQLSAIR